MSWSVNLVGPADVVKKAIEAETHMPVFVQNYLLALVTHVGSVIEKWAETQIDKIFHVHLISNGHVDEFNASHQSDVKPVRVVK